MKESGMNYRKEMNELMEPTSVMVFDASGNVSYEVEPLIKPAKKGLYYGAELLPILADSQEYVAGSGNTEQTVTPANGTHWTVDDIKKWKKLGLRTKLHDRLVLSPEQKFVLGAFSREPVANPNLILFIFRWTQNYLASISPYAKRGNLQDRMMECLNGQESCEKLLSGEIDKMLEPLSCEIANWVGRDVWHMYFVKNRHTSVTIEKTSDYRVWCYYEMLQKVEEKEE